jgi:hypothetical protein
MLTEQELNALVTLLQRAPMTPAETLWANSLLERLRAQIEAAQQPPPAKGLPHDG